MNERYEKKQVEFEAAWAEYQDFKNNVKLLASDCKFMQKICNYIIKCSAVCVNMWKIIADGRK